MPDFAESVLGLKSPGLLQEELEARYPVRRAGDSIAWASVQWVEGDNEKLRYRGHKLRRGKIWLQRGAPPGVGFRRYLYTGWQWGVLPATADVAACPEVLPLADAYDGWCEAGGVPKANHYIVTRYEDGAHGIGYHFDKPKDIAPDSLITVVKTGRHGRPFAVRRRAAAGEDQAAIAPFFSEVLCPGTAVVMTLQANLETQHSVPEVDAPLGSSSSIVFRTVGTTFGESEARTRIAAAERVAKRKRDE